jgi:uncharacterized repeat protein (TIGR02543 family)
MNMTLGSRRRHYIVKVGLSLLILALIAGMTGCVAGSSGAVRYDLTIASDQGGSVDVPGEGTFTCDAGRIIDISAIPDSGYRFANWTGDVDTINNPYVASTSITMDDDYSITANFEQTETPYYTLTMAVTGSGATSPDVGQHTRAAGTDVYITASPASGYRFVNWTTPAGSFENANAAETTFTMPGQDVTVTAHFQEAVPYTLTMAVTGSGSTSPAVGQHTYTAGTSVTISASPASGYYFSHWTAAAGSFTNASSATTTFTMPAQGVTVTAHFEEAVPYTLTMAVTGSGSTSPAVGQHTYTAGTSVIISASPASGYYFSHWTAAAGSFTNASSATTTFTMPGQDITVTAHFVEGPPVPPDEYTLTMAVTGSGSTSPAVGQHTYTAGTAVAISASPASGYYFSHWTAAAGSFTNASSATTTFTMPGQDVTVTAQFELAPTYALTMAVTPPGSGTATDQTGVGSYQAGAQVSIKAQAVAGYYFVNWAAAAGSFTNASSATTTFTMPAQDVTVTAHFELAPTYTLTMAVTGSGSTSPAVGEHTYTAGTAVPISASPASGYYFSHWTAAAGSFTNASSATTTFTMPAEAVTVTAHFEWINFMVSAGDLHTVGLKSNGTVLAVGDNTHGQCNVGSWTTITQVTAGGFHTVGLKSDGTVVATGNNNYGQCNVGGWTGIVQVAAGGYHTVGLKSDGSVVAVGYNYYGQRNVGGWTDIIEVAADGFNTVGLKSDGTVVATGNNWYGQRNVSGWTNIIQVTAGSYHTVGLRSNGAVVAVGDNAKGQCNVGGWTNIIQIAAGGSHTVGLRANGTVVAVGDNYHGQRNVSGWTGIIQVTAGWQHTVGVKSDGTVVAVGWNEYGECNVGSWDLR